MGHRIIRPDGTHQQSKFLRWVRSVAYLLMAVSGALLVVSGIVDDVYGGAGEVMSWFLVVGGLLSALGSLTSRWVGEFTGLPLLASAFAVFGFLSWKVGADFALLAGANLAMLVAISLFMVARWRVVLAVYRFATHMTRPKGTR